jgi:diguanylate cyclase (GGDEF)-like protein/PAS domain S-box-containing protein
MEPRAYFILPNLIAALGMLYLVGLIWTRRRRKGGLPLLLMVTGASIWAGAEGLLYLDISEAARILITKFQYLGIALSPAAILTFVLIRADRLERLTFRFMVGIYALPAMILVLAWTNQYHHLIWARMWTDTDTAFPMLALIHGPAFWVYIAYCYVMLAISAILTYSWAVHGPAVFRGQAYAILVSVLLPWIANLIYLSGLSPVPNMDLTAVSFAFLSVGLAWSFLRYRLLDLVPVARTTVFKGLSSGVLVLDNENRVLDLNPAAQKMLNLGGRQVVGFNLAELPTEDPGLLQAIGRDDQPRQEVCLASSQSQVYLEVRSTPLSGRRGAALGRLVLLEDISERKRMEKELRRLAATDPLTGLANRRTLMDLGERELAHSRRHRRPLSMLMMDIDHFKQINDKYGHQQGDKVLKALAEACSRLLRQSDLMARVGGEEFAILLPDTPAANAMEVAERMRSSVTLLTTFDGQDLPHITISVGGATTTGDSDCLNSLLRRADDALYQAKAAGRNTCRLGQ